MKREETEQSIVKIDLIPVSNEKALQIYTEGDIEWLLNDVKQKVKQATPENLDLSVKKNRDIHISNAADVSRAKVSFDNAGKSITEDWKAKSKKVDGVRKYFRDCMDYLRDETRQPVTVWEAEQDRIEKEAVKLAAYLSDWDQAIADNDLINREREVAKKEAEFKKIEEDRLAKVEADRIEKERVDREERLQKEAADNAKREAEKKVAKAKADKEEAKRKLKEAEQKRKDDAVRAELAQKEAVAEAERKAKAEATRKENERLETQRIEKEKAEKKAANVRHQKRINNQALHDLVLIKGVSDELGKEIIKQIALGKVDHISINY